MYLPRHLKNTHILSFIKAWRFPFWDFSLFHYWSFGQRPLPGASLHMKSKVSYQPLLKASDEPETQAQLARCVLLGLFTMRETRKQGILRVRILTVAVREVMTALAAVTTYWPFYSCGNELQHFLLPGFLLSFLIFLVFPISSSCSHWFYKLVSCS